MDSATIRDQVADPLITPKNAALVLIDYQPSQFQTIRSMDTGLLLKNTVSTVKLAKTFGVPIVHSTVNVASGQVGPTVPELAELLADYPPIDRTTINSWEDLDFVPISWVSLACELQRDWNRAATVPAIVEIVITDRLLKE
jgi:nicotinamidase-related amidase